MATVPRTLRPGDSVPALLAAWRDFWFSDLRCDKPKHSVAKPIRNKLSAAVFLECPLSLTGETAVMPLGLAGVPPARTGRGTRARGTALTGGGAGDSARCWPLGGAVRGTLVRVVES